MFSNVFQIKGKSHKEFFHLKYNVTQYNTAQFGGFFPVLINMWFMVYTVIG